MKKLFKLFICILMCFSFVSLVKAEDGIKLINEDYDVTDEEYPEDEEDDWPEEEEEYPEDGEYEDWDDAEDEYPEDEGVDEGYEDDLYNDANEENSQTGDIPIILISSIAIISLIVVLSKKNTFVNNGY